MTAGRKALPAATAEGPDYIGATPTELAEHEATINQAQALADKMSDDVLAAGIDLGRLEAMTFITTIGESAALAIYENIKKSKAWRLLSNPENSDGRKFESLDEFCRVKLGKSYNRLQEITANRHLIGETAFEQAEKIGLRQSDFNLLKTLPQPKQEIIKDALAEGATKEELQKALRELASADQREIEKAQADLASKDKALAEATANLQAKEKNMADKNSKIDELTEALTRSQRQINDLPPVEIGERIRVQATQMFSVAEVELRKLKAPLLALAQHSEAHGIEHGNVMAGLVAQLRLTLNQLAAEFDIDAQPDADLTPAWQREGAEAEALAATESAALAAGWIRDGNGKLVRLDETQGDLLMAAPLAGAFKQGRVLTPIEG